MESHIIGEIIRHLMSPSKLPSSRNVLHLAKMLAKHIPYTLLISQTVVKSINYLLQPDVKSLILKTTLTRVIEHGETELAPN